MGNKTPLPIILERVKLIILFIELRIIAIIPKKNKMLLTLPREILFQILYSLDPCDLPIIACCNSYLHQIIREEKEFLKMRWFKRLFLDFTIEGYIERRNHWIRLLELSSYIPYQWGKTRIVIEGVLFKGKDLHGPVEIKLESEVAQSKLSFLYFFGEKRVSWYRSSLENRLDEYSKGKITGKSLRILSNHLTYSERGRETRMQFQQDVPPFFSGNVSSTTILDELEKGIKECLYLRYYPRANDIFTYIEFKKKNGKIIPDYYSKGRCMFFFYMKKGSEKPDEDVLSSYDKIELYNSRLFFCQGEPVLVCLDDNQVMEIVQE